MMETLQEALHRRAGELGADYFGVADLTLATDFITQGGDFLARYPRAVSVGIRLPEGIVEQLPQHQEPLVAQTYDYTVYTIVNAALDRTSLALCGLLQAADYAALAVPASQIADRANLQGLFSHKLAAHLAGLGWIGKSCLLITPDHGPRVRWVTVLTDAPLVAGDPMADRCRACKLCVTRCPPQAFSGRHFQEDEPRQVRFNAHACEEYRLNLSKTTGARSCGMCVYVCPYGRKGRGMEKGVRRG